MVLFVPPGAAEEHAIPNVIQGSINHKLTTILSDEENIVELDHEEYKLLKDIVQACDIDYRIVLAIPDVPTPQSYLHETDDSKVISYANLKPKQVDDDQEFMNKIKGSEELVEDNLETED